MNGLELSRLYFEKYGYDLINRVAPDLFERIAVGLVGHGSECYGYDDEISKDHDFLPSFNIWLSEEDMQTYGFKLSREYERLPRELEGVKLKEQSLFGSGFRGVKSIKEFYSYYLPNGEIPKDLLSWLYIPDFYLAEATNGEIYFDNSGEFSRIRNEIKNRPDDVRLKKLSGSIFKMAQSGQYNYLRSIKHGEQCAAALYLSDFCENAAVAVHLIKNRFAPYKKWLFRSLSTITEGGIIAKKAESLLKEPYKYKENEDIIEEICSIIAKMLKESNLCDCNDTYLEPHAYQINENVKDALIRNEPLI